MKGTDEPAELAGAAQNPAASLISVPFQNNTDSEFTLERKRSTSNIQPAWPLESPNQTPKVFLVGGPSPRTK